MLKSIIGNFKSIMGTDGITGIMETNIIGKCLHVSKSNVYAHTTLCLVSLKYLEVSNYKKQRCTIVTKLIVENH